MNELSIGLFTLTISISSLIAVLYVDDDIDRLRRKTRRMTFSVQWTIVGVVNFINTLAIILVYFLQRGSAQQPTLSRVGQDVLAGMPAFVVMLLLTLLTYAFAMSIWGRSTGSKLSEWGFKVADDGLFASNRTRWIGCCTVLLVLAILVLLAKQE